MSTRTRYAVLFVHPDSEETSIEGVFLELPAALSFIRELNGSNGVGVQHYEVEGWRGRNFEGCWNHAGMLIEDRKGRHKP